MIGNLTAKQIILIILGVIVVIWLVSWLIKSRSKKAISDKQISTVPLTNSDIQNSDAPAQIFDQDNQPYILYYFHSQQCPHCKKFSPIWAQVSQALRQTKFNIKFKEIDMTKAENENLIFYYNVNSVPTVILVTPNQSLEYTGNKTPDDLYNFVVSNLSQ